MASTATTAMRAMCRQATVRVPSKRHHRVARHRSSTAWETSSAASSAASSAGHAAAAPTDFLGDGTDVNGARCSGTDGGDPQPGGPSERGTAFTLNERGVPFTRTNAFYRVESAQARDLAVLLASVMTTQDRTPGADSFSTSPPSEEKGNGDASDSSVFTVLDCMSGCGVRSARYLLQGNVASVHANDADPNVMDALRENLAAAADTRGASSVTTMDAHRLLARCYLEDIRYDIVDVDSFGSENLVAAALRCVKRGGHLYLTGTDALALSGKRPRHLSMNYGGAHVAPNTQGVNEVGLRVLVGDAVRIGASMGLKLTPVFSLFHPHGPVFRAMLRVDKLKGEWEAACVGYVGRCRACGDARVVQPTELGGAFCRTCGEEGTSTRRVQQCLEVSGPMWLGPLHERATVERLRVKALEKGWIGDGSAGVVSKVKGQMTLEALLDVFATEADTRLPPFHHRTDELARSGRGLTRGIPPARAWIEELQHRGYAACRTHVDARGLKTDAPMDQVIDAANAVTRARDVTA